MRRLALALVALLALMLRGGVRAQDSDAPAADTQESGGDWSGRWRTRWSGGEARLELKQTGDKVHGLYQLLGGEFDGTAKGRKLSGTWKEPGRSGSFSFRMAPDYASFMGQFDNGEWWTGGRTGLRPRSTQMDLSSPRATLRSFLLAGIRATEGEDDELSRANQAVLQPLSIPRLQRLEGTTALYQLIDLTTIRLYEIPTPTSETATVTLTQAGTPGAIKLEFQMDKGEHVGIRSTRIRSAEDSLIVVPNGKLSDATIDNLGSRRTRRITSTLVLPYSAGRAAVSDFVAGLAEMLRAHKGVVSETVDVGVNTLTGDGYDVGISLHLDAQTGKDERTLRQGILLDIVKLGDKAGIPVGKAHTPEAAQASA